MSNDTNPMTSVNQQFRAMMESSVAQAKKAYDQYVAGFERFLTSMEDANRIAWSGARDVNVRFMTFVDENARAGFEYAERLTKAKELERDDVHSAGLFQAAESTVNGTNA